MSSLIPNATPLQRALADEAATLLDLPVDTLRTLMDPATCPAHLLPWLAWALRVPQWSASYPESVRRDLCASAWEVHRHKGTLGAVHRVLAALGVVAEVREWWQTGGAPHTFGLTAWVSQQLTTGGPVLSDALIAELLAAIDDAKPVRSQCDLTVGAGYRGGLRVASVASGRAAARINAPAIRAPRTHAATVRVAAVASAATAVHAAAAAVRAPRTHHAPLRCACVASVTAVARTSEL